MCSISFIGCKALWYITIFALSSSLDFTSHLIFWKYAQPEKFSQVRDSVAKTAMWFHVDHFEFTV